MFLQKRIAGGTEHTGGLLGTLGKLTPEGAREIVDGLISAGATFRAGAGGSGRPLADFLCEACFTAAACTATCLDAAFTEAANSCRAPGDVAVAHSSAPSPPSAHLLALAIDTSDLS